jgi:hypothetical protein
LTRESEMQDDAKLGLSGRLLVTNASDSFSFCLLFPEQKNGNGKEIKGNI